jgi:hypothetical protein
VWLTQAVAGVKSAELDPNPNLKKKPETKLVHAAVINSTFYEKTMLLNLQFSPMLI